MRPRLLLVPIVLASATAAAQPPPVDPYAGEPSDPYATPHPAGKAAKPAPKPARPAPKPKGPPPPPLEEFDLVPGAKAPVTAPRPGGAPDPAATRPVDPYATPAARPPQPGAPPPPPAASAPPSAPPKAPPRVGIADVAAVQGLLAVQRLDGWLLVDRAGDNPIARRLVAPAGQPTRPWFYLIPAKGAPVALVHAAEARHFDHLAGTRLAYAGYRQLEAQLKVLLKGRRTVAVEYSPKAAVPAVSRVDAGTLELIRAAGVQVRSSETLVQYTKAAWGDAGRTAHHLAAHHVIEARREALQFIARQLQSNAPVTEYDVQQRLARGLQLRGLVGPPPRVAAGVNTADPGYAPTAAGAARIRRGDLIVVSIAAKLDKPDGVFVAQTWCAVADAFVRDEYQKAFEAVVRARDHALGLIADRSRKQRAITGAEVDRETRGFLKKLGHGDQILHRTGHSIDSDLQGGGADLDDFEVKDTRILTPGTGVTIGPGLYLPGQFGVRTEISVYLAPTGPEVTTPAQDVLEVLFRR